MAINNHSLLGRRIDRMIIDDVAGPFDAGVDYARKARSERVSDRDFAGVSMDANLLETNVAIDSYALEMTRDKLGFLSHVKNTMGRQLGDAIMEQAKYGLQQEECIMRRQMRYRLTVAVMDPVTYKALKRDADEAKALRDRVAKLEAQLKVATVKAEKFDNIKKALA